MQTGATMADLNELLKQAKARVDAMTPAEGAEMHQAQRERWVRGMCTPCEHGVLDFEQCPECRAPSSNAAEGAAEALDKPGNHRFVAVDAGLLRMLNDALLSSTGWAMADIVPLTLITPHLDGASLCVGSGGMASAWAKWVVQRPACDAVTTDASGASAIRNMGGEG